MKKSVLFTLAFLGLLVGCTNTEPPFSSSTLTPTTTNTTSNTTTNSPSSSTSSVFPSSSLTPTTSTLSPSSSSLPPKEERDYLTIEEAILLADDEDSLWFATKSGIIDGKKEYVIRGTISRIDVGADNKYNVYIQSQSEENQLVGLYIYGASDIAQASIGDTIEVTGVFKNYKGCVELIPTQIQTIEDEGVHEITPYEITPNELLNSTFLKQGIRVSMKGATIVDAPLPSIYGHTSGYYPTIMVDGVKLGVKVDTRNKDKTTEIANFIVQTYQNDKTFDIEGNITFNQGEYRLSIGKKSDMKFQDGEAHEHNYLTYLPYDESYHYEICDCGDQHLAPHIESDWIIDQEATLENTGKRHTECTKCKQILLEETIDKVNPSSSIDINFYAINDFHGVVKDSSNAPGIEKTATKLKELKSTKENAVILSSGDMWQGSMYSNQTRGNLITEWMNELGFVSMTVGNHEFDWGEENIIKNRELANFPTLGINVFDKETNQRVSYLDASTIVEQKDIKIGIIGAIGNCYSSISGSQVKNVEFKVGNELANLVINEAKRLKQKEGCQIVVYSLHDSMDSSGYQESISASNYVDIVFEGHTHTDNFNKVDSYGVYHLQSGGYNTGVSHATLTYDYATKNVSTKVAENISTSSWLNVSKDANTTALLEKYAPIIGDPSEVLGYNASNRSSTELRQKSAELMMEYGKKSWGNQYDIVLGGGYLSVRSPYTLSSGNVSKETIYNLFPFDNNMILCSATGAFLSRYYIHSSNKYYAVSFNDGYSSSTTLEDNKIYYFVTDTYGSDYYLYGNGYRENNQFKIVEQASDPCYLRDLFYDYIRNGNYAK